MRGILSWRFDRRYRPQLKFCLLTLSACSCLPACTYAKPLMRAKLALSGCFELPQAVNNSPSCMLCSFCMASCSLCVSAGWVSFHCFGTGFKQRPSLLERGLGSCAWVMHADQYCTESKMLRMSVPGLTVQLCLFDTKSVGLAVLNMITYKSGMAPAKRPTRIYTQICGPQRPMILLSFVPCASHPLLTRSQRLTSEQQAIGSNDVAFLIVNCSSVEALHSLCALQACLNLSVAWLTSPTHSEAVPYEPK